MRLWIIDHLTEGEDSRPRWFNVCEYGRVHHPVGLCPRQLRPWLRLSGSPHTLHLCDVSSSQIVLVALWVSGLLSGSEAEEIAGRGEKKREGRGRGRERGILSGRYGDGLREFALMNEKKKGRANHALSGRSSESLKEAALIIEGALDGEGFPLLVRTTNEVLRAEGRPPLTPGEVKVGRLSALFGDWRFLADKPVGRALLRLYPAFMGLWAERVKGLPHGELARLMQRIESGIMIHGAAARLMRERPDARFVTIHDAVLVEQPHTEYAVRVIRDEWEAAVGVAPLVKQSPLVV